MSKFVIVMDVMWQNSMPTESTMCCIGIRYKNNAVQFPLVYSNNLVQWNAKNLLSQKEKNPTPAKRIPCFSLYKIPAKPLYEICHNELSVHIITSYSQKCNIFKGFSIFNINVPSTLKIPDAGTTSQYATSAHSHRSAYHHSTRFIVSKVHTC
jgi:hypothetical protein